MQQVVSGVPCQVRSCPVSLGPDIDLYNFQDALIFNENELSFVVTCPPGYECPPGTFPKVVTYPRGTFYLPDPGRGGGFPIYMSLQGCQSLVYRWLPSTATQAEIIAAANDIILAVAIQQAECDSIDGLNPTPTYFNQQAEADVDCPAGSVLAYTGTLPAYLSIDGNSVVLSAGVVGGSTQAEANQTAQNFLDSWVDTEFFAGRLECMTCAITTSSPLSSATQGVSYSMTFTADDAGPNPQWTVTSGSLPVGMSLGASTGELSGTPTAIETAAFTVTLTTDTTICHKDFLISVVAAGSCPFNDITWSAPTYNWQLASGSASGGVIACSATAPAGSPYEENISFSGSFSYTGPATTIGCRFNMSSLSGDNASASVLITSSVDGILLDKTLTQADGPGIYDYPFTIPLSVGATITVVTNFSAGFIDFGPGSGSSIGSIDVCETAFNWNNLSWAAQTGSLNIVWNETSDIASNAGFGAIGTGVSSVTGTMAHTGGLTACGFSLNGSAGSPADMFTITVKLDAAVIYTASDTVPNMFFVLSAATFNMPATAGTITVEVTADISSGAGAFLSFNMTPFS